MQQAPERKEKLTVKRTLDNCGHIKTGMHLGYEKPKQEGGKCAGYREMDNKLMPACERCKLRM